MISGDKQPLKGTVTTVVPLTEGQYSKLLAKLEAKYNKKIELTKQIDKSIIGGIFVEIENEIIDATINSQYNEMKELMLNRK